MTAPPLRAVIVDDEPLARRRLRTLLAGHPDVELVGECGDGPEAVDVITRERPDVVFLDVQMAELDGLDVARAVAATAAAAADLAPPALVFVTAFEQYAVDAFGVRALDYLLKPFDEERFAETIARAREHVASARSLAAHHQLLTFVHELERAGAPPRRRREVLRVADLEIDVAARTARRGGTALFLRRKEFDLLVALARRAGEVVTRRELLAEVWEYKADVVSRTVDTHMAELRRKLGHAPSEPEYIQTVARTGYRIRE
jgi:DNA-binding response OmpR family regulator